MASLLILSTPLIAVVVAPWAWRLHLRALGVGTSLRSRRRDELQSVLRGMTDHGPSHVSALISPTPSLL